MKISRSPARLCAIGGLFLFILSLTFCLRLANGGPLDKLGIAFLLLVWGAAGIMALRRFQLSEEALLCCLLALGLAALIRVICLDHATGDYRNFLAPWTQYFRDNGGFAGIRDSVGDYNVPYLYFLAGISYLPVPDLYLIKLFSIFFDLLLAVAGFRLVLHVFGDEKKAALVFSLLLLLPTAVLNGAYWGQCDSLYAALVLLALSDALERHPARSVVWLAVAFSFKLQTIFLIPLWCALWFSRRVKFWHLLLFPVSYFVTILPALLLGKPLGDILGIYFNQTTEYSKYLSMNSPSVYALIPLSKKVNVPLLAKLGIIAAFLLVAALLLWLFSRRAHLTDHQLLAAALVLAIGVPLFLPHMHDRYFFMADTLALVWAVGRRWRAPTAFLVQAASLSGYYAYLVRNALIDLPWAPCLLLVALASVAISLVASPPDTAATHPADP